jgi:hypothetical protein
MSDNKLSDFKDLVNDISDIEILETGQGLLRDMMKIAALKEELSELESGLTEGGRAMFYFFAMSLGDEEIPYMTEKIVGRVNRLSLKEKRENSDTSSTEE